MDFNLRSRFCHSCFSLSLRISVIALTVWAALGAQEVVTIQRLSQIRRIFVGSFGPSEGANLLQNQIISRLFKSRRFEIVNSPDSADAILSGAAATVTIAGKSRGPKSGTGNTHFNTVSAVQLTNQDHTVLWADESSKGLSTKSISSSAAARIVKGLLKAINKDVKRP